jgi:hypothetical protein
VKISASIMAHPDRARMVAELAAGLAAGWGGRQVPVHFDPHGAPSGKGDRVWSVAREAWSMHDPGADFHVLVQDDAIPSPDMLPALEKALEHVPDYALVSPYLGQGRNVPRRWGKMADQADDQGASWICSYVLMWGVCLAVPVAMIPEMIAWCDRKSGMPDDMRVGRWFQRQKIDTWYTWPSLVDHRPGDSLTKHRQVERIAVRHHLESALELAWDGPTVVDPMVLRRRGPRSAPRGAWR